MILIFNPCTCHANHAAMPMQLNATSSLAFSASSNWPKLGKGFVSTWKLQPWIVFGRWSVGGGLNGNRWNHKFIFSFAWFPLWRLQFYIHLLFWDGAKHETVHMLFSKETECWQKKCTLYTPRLTGVFKGTRTHPNAHTALRNYRPLCWEKPWFFTC